jgi:hypothetical protein
MADHSHAHAPEIRNPGPHEIAGGTRTLLLLFAAVGLVTFGIGLATDAPRTWTSFLHNHFFFMSLALGGGFIAALQWLTGAMWSAPVRRLSESFTAYLPFALLCFIALYFGMHHLYRWTDPAYVHGDHVLENKSGYLSIGFFFVRNIVALLAWIFLSRALVGNSVAQDSDRSYSYTARNRVLAPAFMIVFGVTFTMNAFDSVMSLDAHWFSTMFGIYCFAGLFYSSLALTCLLTLSLRGKLVGIINDNHLHDIGKFMFAFTVFWAYIGFAQFMLIWYANLPEETGYFMRRFHENWLWVSIFLLVGKFLTPFFLLLPRDSKRNPTMLRLVGCFMLFAQWIDVMWMVQPEFYAEGPRFGWLEGGVLLGFVGIFGLAVARFLGRNNIVAIGDPRLAESVFHHHQ